MRQASILGWLKEKKSKPKKRPKVAYFFEMAFPEGIMLPDLKTAGPFKKGDLVSEGALPEEVWRVLLKRRAVRRYYIRPEYPRGG